VGELLLGGLGGQQPDAGALLRPGLGEHELAAAFEPHPERRGLRSRLTRSQIPQPAGRHQVDEQHELSVLGREEESLPAPLCACQPPPLERRQRRIERLQGRDVRWARALDRKRAHRVVDGPPQRLNLR
jgi:hypothetical protein